MTKNKHEYLLLLKFAPDSDAELDYMRYIAWNVMHKYNVTGMGGKMANGLESCTNNYMIYFRWMEDLAEAYCYVKKELRRRRQKTWEVTFAEEDLL